MKTGSVDRAALSLRELLWQVLAAKHRELLEAMCAAGPIPIRMAAGLV